MAMLKRLLAMLKRCLKVTPTPVLAAQRVIELGKLNLRVLELFEETEHEALLAAIRGLGIRRWTPPLLPTSRGGPLGYGRPPWE